MRATISSTWTQIVLSEGAIFLAGTAAANDMTMETGVIGLAGMGGNDTLRAGTAEGCFLFGDFFSADMFEENAPYDYSVIGNDLLIGGAGEDILVGGMGRDTLIGGGGPDRYVVFARASADIREAAGAGRDTVVTDGTSYTLGKNLENLVFFGFSRVFRKSVVAIGNELDNQIETDAGNDRLQGMNGDDTLMGGTGKDILTGGAGEDHFVFGVGARSPGALSTGRLADRVTDFVAADDQIVLDPFSFRDPAASGALRAAQFGLIGDTLTGKEVVLYDHTTGDLMTKAHKVFARLAPGTDLTYHDIEWFF